MKAQLISHLQSRHSINQSKLQTSSTFSGYLPCCLNASTIDWDCQVGLKSALTKFGRVLAKPNRDSSWRFCSSWSCRSKPSSPLSVSWEVSLERFSGHSFKYVVNESSKKADLHRQHNGGGQCQTFGLWSTQYMTNNRETDTVKAFYGSLVGGGEKLITAATSHTIINVLLCLEKCSSFRAFDV